MPQRQPNNRVQLKCRSACGVPCMYVLSLRRDIVIGAFLRPRYTRSSRNENSEQAIDKPTSEVVCRSHTHASSISNHRCVFSGRLRYVVMMVTLNCQAVATTRFESAYIRRKSAQKTRMQSSGCGCRCNSRDSRGTRNALYMIQDQRVQLEIFCRKQRDQMFIVFGV